MTGRPEPDRLLELAARRLELPASERRKGQPAERVRSEEVEPGRRDCGRVRGVLGAGFPATQRALHHGQHRRSDDGRPAAEHLPERERLEPGGVRVVEAAVPQLELRASAEGEAQRGQYAPGSRPLDERVDRPSRPRILGVDEHLGREPEVEQVVRVVGREAEVEHRDRQVRRLLRPPLV